MKNLRICFWSGLCAAVVMFTACAGHHTNSRTAELLDDKVITDRVEMVLRRASTNTFAQVQATTTDGVVTLKGFVPDAAAKAEAARLAGGVESVHKVENELQVRPVEHPSHEGGS